MDKKLPEGWSVTFGIPTSFEGPNTLEVDACFEGFLVSWQEPNESHQGTRRVARLIPLEVIRAATAARAIELSQVKKEAEDNG